MADERGVNGRIEGYVSHEAYGIKKKWSSFKDERERSAINNERAMKNGGTRNSEERYA